MEFLHKTTVTRAEIVTEGAPDDEIPILNRHILALGYKVGSFNMVKELN